MDDDRRPDAVVAKFIEAMNAWELRAWELSRIARDSPAHVETARVSALGGGSYRYTLHRRQGRWLIDGLKRKDGDRWVRDIL